MSRVNLIDPASVNSAVKPLLDQIKGAFGVVPNMFKAVANSPAVRNLPQRGHRFWRKADRQMVMADSS